MLQSVTLKGRYNDMFGHVIWRSHYMKNTSCKFHSVLFFNLSIQPTVSEAEQLLQMMCMKLFKVDGVFCCSKSPHSTETTGLTVIVHIMLTKVYCCTKALVLSLTCKMTWIKSFPQWKKKRRVKIKQILTSFRANSYVQGKTR